MEGDFKEQLNVTSGVRQDSVLGPVLFPIYIKEVASAVWRDVLIRLFLDDFMLSRGINILADRVCLNNSLKLISKSCTR